MARMDLRERILDAARQVLLENGPRRRLISAIAERAEVSRPTLYRHFPERLDIYDSLIRVELERVIEDLVSKADTTRSPREEYVGVVVGLVQEAREHPALRAVLAGHPEIMATHLPRILPLVLEIAEPRLAPVLEAGTRDGRWPAIDARVAIIWTARLITSMITMPLPEDSGPLELRASVESLLDVALSLSAPPPA